MQDITLKDLLEAGSHFGHQARRWNPSMSKYIYTEKDGIHIFDLAKSKAGLDEAREFVKQIAARGGKVWFVGTKRQAAQIVRQEALRAGMPYVTQRWMGGMLTNFAQVFKSTKKLNDLKEQREKGELKKFTKREQLLIDREISKLERFLGGLSGETKVPDALFVIDTHREDVAVREANRMNVPVVGMVDTNGEPERVNYVIAVNDDAVKSIELIVRGVTDAIVEGREGQAGEVKEEKTEKKPRSKKKEAASEEVAAAE